MLRERIFELRRRHKSYREIADILDVSKSTVSYWLAANKESQSVKELLTRKNNARNRKRMRRIAAAAQKRWGAWRAAARKDAKRSFPEFIKNPLFVSGIAIYWGEGDNKPGNPLRMSNTDPRMIRLYSRFLKNVLDVPVNKIRLALILYPDLNDMRCRRFWTRVTSLRLTNFIKTQYIRGYHPTKRLKNGICVVIVNSRELKEKVLVWIDLLSKNHKM